MERGLDSKFIVEGKREREREREREEENGSWRDFVFLVFWGDFIKYL